MTLGSAPLRVAGPSPAVYRLVRSNGEPWKTLCAPCRSNPLGAKGVGELGTVGARPTVINAIVDALRPLGVTDLPMPATPERIWRAILQARSSLIGGSYRHPSALR